MNEDLDETCKRMSFEGAVFKFLKKIFVEADLFLCRHAAKSLSLLSNQTSTLSKVRASKSLIDRSIGRSDIGAPFKDE